LKSRIGVGPKPQVPEATLRPAAQQAHHDSYAGQIELRGNVTDNKQNVKARVERSFTFGIEAN